MIRTNDKNAGNISKEIEKHLHRMWVYTKSFRIEALDGTPRPIKDKMDSFLVIDMNLAEEYPDNGDEVVATLTGFIAKRPIKYIIFLAPETQTLDHKRIGAQLKGHVEVTYLESGDDMGSYPLYQVK